MNFTQVVLQLFQVLPPALMETRQEIFYRVAESFEANAQAMVTNLGAVPKHKTVELTRFLPALQRKMPENQAARLQPVCPRG